jgi:thiol-disulfide isomerase/thioredoxin
VTAALAVTLALLLMGAPSPPAATIAIADLPQILAAIRAPGASAVLVNLWASWCEPCVEEMPEILRFYRDHKAQGLRLVLISADDPDKPAPAQQFLASLGVDFPTFAKADGDDMAFINGLDPRWSGGLPASFLYDGKGQSHHLWEGKVTYAILAAKLAELTPKQRQPDKTTKAKKTAVTKSKQ